MCQTQSSGSGLSDQVLAKQFKDGLAAAADPGSVGMKAGDIIVTGPRSSWLYLHCPRCAHTFRLGDVVTMTEGGAVQHVDGTPFCNGADASGGAATATPCDADVETGFLNGLDAAWPPPTDLPLRRLLSGHPLLAPAFGGFQRKTCVVCGHTFRPLDQVVLCPCRPTRPTCQAAIHRDPDHGLHCWEDWNPTQYRLHCPSTSRALFSTSGPGAGAGGEGGGGSGNGPVSA